jgi:acid phosphatase (class A)
MNCKSILPRRNTRTARVGRGIAFCLLLSLAAQLFAGQYYLAAGVPDGVALLAPPPLAGSSEETADLASVRAVFNGRTPAEEARARKDASLAFTLFEPAIGPVFHPGNLPKTDAFLEKVKADIGEAINAPKNYWKRLRPFQMDSRLSLGFQEQSFSYPSGHSTRGTVYALILAELFPEQKEGVLAVGRDIGWDRVLIGMHFPTDIYAGRTLGKAIMRELQTSPAFQHDLEEAKAEVKSRSAAGAQEGKPQ